MKIKFTHSYTFIAIADKYTDEETREMCKPGNTVPDTFAELKPTKTAGVYTVDVPHPQFDPVTSELTGYGVKAVKVKVYGNKVGTFNRWNENTNPVGVLVE